MQKIAIKNRTLLKVLDDYIQVCLKYDLEKYMKVEYDPQYKTEEYLVEVLEDEEEKFKGKPPYTYGVELADAIYRAMPQHPEWDGLNYNFEQAILKLLPEGTKTALRMYYPEKGYIGWHSNKDAPGYNIIFSWSQTGDGYFRFYDNATGEFVDIEDDEGWNCKVGYYGTDVDPENIFFHMAETNSPRFTFGFILPDRRAQEKLIKTLTRLV